MRRLLSSLIMLMPLAAAGQTLGSIKVPADAAATTSATPMAAYRSLQRTNGSGHVVLPLWRDADGRMLALVGTDTPDDASGAVGALDFHVVDVSQGFSSGLRYDIGPHVDAYAKLAQRSWLTPATAASTCTPGDGISCPDASTLNSARLLSGEFGASYHGKGYRFDVLVDTTAPRGTASLLPRVLPRSDTSASGVPLWALDQSTHVSARGRFALGQETGIDLGASVGRVRLLPGNLLGVHSLGQQSLSLGVDSGPLSGRITGRMMQPEAGDAGNDPLGPERHWTSIDLGVTWRLPWQGELRFGAHNVWSSGQAPRPADGPQPDQSRIPYVQYHQDL